MASSIKGEEVGLDGAQAQRCPAHSVRWLCLARCVRSERLAQGVLPVLSKQVCVEHLRKALSLIWDSSKSSLGSSSSSSSKMNLSLVFASRPCMPCTTHAQHTRNTQTPTPLGECLQDIALIQNTPPTTTPCPLRWSPCAVGGAGGRRGRVCCHAPRRQEVVGTWLNC